MLDRAETEWLGHLPRSRTGSSGTETLQVRQHHLSLVIEFDVAIFGRMVDDLAGLVMLDADRRRGTGAVGAPLDVSGIDLFGALQPLEADRGDCRLNIAVVDAAIRKDV
jgi:hypothetical protein